MALVGNDEWFSRPGSGRLETRFPRDLFATGMLSTGDYANHARAVFASSLPVFDYSGTEELAGRQAVRFRYDVSLLNSGYRLHNWKRSALVAYHGTFSADPSSGDLLRLDVIVDDIPREVGILVATTRVDYASVQISGSAFLLPSLTDLTVTYQAGLAEWNRMTFSRCRQYGTEAAVSFEPPETLPSGLAMTLELVTDLNTEDLQAGQPVLARLAKDVKSGDKTLILTGSVVLGRVLQVERLLGSPAMVRITLEFDKIASGETRYVFDAALTKVAEEGQVRVSEPGRRIGIVSLLAPASYRLGRLVSTWKTH